MGRSRFTSRRQLIKDFSSGQSMLAIFLLVFAEEFADGLDAGVDQRQRGAVVAFLECDRGFGPGVHHLDVRAILVEFELVALAGGIPADEREEPKVPQGVERDNVVAFEMKGGEITVIVLQSLTHEVRAIVG